MGPFISNTNYLSFQLRLLGNQILAVNENAMDIGIDHVPELHSLRSLIVKDSSIDGNNQNPFGREDLFDNANNVVYIKALVSDFRLICNKPHVRHLTLESCEEDFFCNLLTAEIQHNIEFSVGFRFMAATSKLMHTFFYSYS